jgi:hypothetical protein
LCALVLLMTRWRDDVLAPRGRAALYFGIVWVAIGLAPNLVSTYASPRHAYLASAGWAIAVAIAFDVLWARAGVTRPALPQRASQVPRWIAAAAAVMLFAAYAPPLRRVLVDWEQRSQLSARAVADVEREALAAPEGALLITGLTPRSWEYSLPYALRPPFTRTAVTERVAVISRSALHCCAADQWERYTRERISAWLARSDRPPVIAMYWDESTGALRRLSDRDDPTLRTLVTLLQQTSDRAALDSTLARLLTDFVALHGSASSGNR